MRVFRSRENILLILLATAVVAALTYGVVTYQTPYGCGPNGVATGPGIDWQVLAEPCIYIYFTGIVGGSVLLILLIPAATTFETIGTPVAASLRTIDQVGSTSYNLGDPLLPAGFVQLSTNPGFTGAVNATLTNYPVTNQWTANVNLAGLTPGPETLYAREVGNDGIVIQTTSVSFIYTVGLAQTAAINSISMVNGNGASQTIFNRGSTGIALVTVKNTGILAISAPTSKSSTRARRATQYS